MTDGLDRFLGANIPDATETALWGNGTIPLRVDAYLTSDEPPLDLVTSVRALILGADIVLVFWDHRSSPQLLPGGRREANESVLETLYREVLEEVGVEPLHPVPLGVLRYHHLGPRPADYAFPYPDFLQPVFLTRPGEDRPEARIHDPYVVRSALCSLTEAEMLPLRAVDRLFLAAALRMRT